LTPSACSSACALALDSAAPAFVVASPAAVEIALFLAVLIASTTDCSLVNFKLPAITSPSGLTEKFEPSLIPSVPT
jgi:hypothetical protein